MAEIKCPECAWQGDEVDAESEEHTLSDDDISMTLYCPSCKSVLDESDIVVEEDGT